MAAAAEVTHDLDTVLRRITVTTNEAVAEVQTLLERYSDAKQSVPLLVATLAAERNALRSQLKQMRERTSLYSDLSVDSDVDVEVDDEHGGGTLLDDDEYDLIAMAAMPSRAQVRKSILSVLNVATPSVATSTKPLDPVQEEEHESFIIDTISTTPISPASPQSTQSPQSPQSLYNRSSTVAIGTRASSKPMSPISALSSPSSDDGGVSPSARDLSSNSASVPPPSPSHQNEPLIPPRQRQPSATFSDHASNLLVIPKRNQSSAASRLSVLQSTDNAEDSSGAAVGDDSSATSPHLAPKPSTASFAPSESLSASTADEVYMEGFLVKKMNLAFGGVSDGSGSGWGWKPRYFKLKETVLEEYDSKSMNKIGTIHLKSTTIVSALNSSSQTQSAGTAHAFTIVEHKHSIPANINIRHTLCTHAQADRDAWVEAINARIPGGSAQGPAIPPKPRPHRTSEQHARAERQESLESGGSATPTRQQQNGQNQFFQSPGQRTAMNMLQEGAVGVARRGLNMVFGGTDKNKKKELPTKQANEPIFGAPLAKGVTLSKLDPEVPLTSIVSRCLEFLETTQAIKEEGIYRLSGSTSQIQHLRSVFDTDLDLNLVKLAEAGEFIDPHAVTGLLKLYLRELPDSILGPPESELKKEIMKLSNHPSKEDKVSELSRLLPMLPIENYFLLRRLSEHLGRVIAEAGVNKMSMVNLSIVFSPTLGVPGGLLQCMVLDYDGVFGAEE
ncbi:hypothetical protein HDU79_009158 [Rhizoclosmatium sp. JEL0117]|nr:hypothetical protein HDU79_009158 [Rhizoclosmatium sp. JEL0117]